MWSTVYWFLNWQNLTEVHVNQSSTSLFVNLDIISIIFKFKNLRNHEQNHDFFYFMRLIVKMPAGISGNQRALSWQKWKDLTISFIRMVKCAMTQYIRNQPWIPERGLSKSNSSKTRDSSEAVMEFWLSRLIKPRPLIWH